MLGFLILGSLDKLRKCVAQTNEILRNANVQRDTAALALHQDAQPRYSTPKARIHEFMG